MIKKGDKVKYIHKSGTCFTNGKIYEVESYDPQDRNAVKIVADDRGNWNGWREEYFELVQDSNRLKIGDKVRWTGDHSLLTKGKIYEIVNITHSSGYNWFHVKTDHNTIDGWQEKYFELIEDSNQCREISLNEAPKPSDIPIAMQTCNHNWKVVQGAMPNSWYKDCTICGAKWEDLYPGEPIK